AGLLPPPPPPWSIRHTPPPAAPAWREARAAGCGKCPAAVRPSPLLHNRPAVLYIGSIGARQPASRGHIAVMQNTRLTMLDHELGPEIDLLRDTVREFTEDRIAPLAAEIDKTDRFPAELWPEMGGLGLQGITVEEEYGGAGMGYLAHCVAMEEVSRGSASVGLSYGAHSNLCVNQIRRNGSEAQKRKYLPDLI